VVEKTSPPTSFVSVFFGIYSKETGDIYYCNAGHPPPLLQKPDTTFPLEVTCPIIGYFTQPTYIDHHETLEQGDRLILYTDGVTDVRTEAGIFGPERFFKLVSRLQTVRVHEIPNEILKALLDYGGGYLPDDIAIVAVSVEELA
jgi:sigma-B regulation protein RsbU (phosphoserine phosphatase)